MPGTPPSAADNIKKHGAASVLHLLSAVLPGAVGHGCTIIVPKVTSLRCSTVQV